MGSEVAELQELTAVTVKVGYGSEPVGIVYEIVTLDTVMLVNDIDGSLDEKV